MTRIRDDIAALIANMTAKTVGELLATEREAIAQRVVELLRDEVMTELLADNGQPTGYLDVEGAARYIAAPRSRVYELVERKRVTVHRDGRRLLFRPEDLEAVLERDESR